MTIIEIIQSIIGTPLYTFDIVQNTVITQYPVYDLQYIVAGILLILTIFTVFQILLIVIKFCGGTRK